MILKNGITVKKNSDMTFSFLGVTSLCCSCYTVMRLEVGDSIKLGFESIPSDSSDKITNISIDTETANIIGLYLNL